MAEQAYATLAALYRQFGECAYIQEPVSQLQHGLQAAVIAQQHTDDVRIIIGALLHDVGHLVGLQRGLPDMAHDCGKMDHDSVGAKYLQALGFPEATCAIVRGHVQAKRYLAWESPDYVAALSHGSQLSLAQQGGPMTDAEAQAFREDPYFDTLVRFRQWEDQAKSVATAELTFEAFQSTILACFY